jgi:hypothetical protein
VEVDLVGKASPCGQHLSNGYILGGQVDARYAASVFSRKMASDTAEAAAHIKDMRTGRQLHHSYDVLRRGTSTHVELVNRGEIARRQGLEINAGVMERFENQ